MGNLNRAAGRSSAAIGQDNFAEGFSSFAGGARNNTKGISSIALGEEDKALGNYSVAVGRLNISGDVNTFTAGLGNSANAPNSSAIGEGLITNAFGGLTIGRFNDTLYARQTSVTASTALFTVGNGFNSGGGRNTAFTIWNSGWAGVNTGVPNSTLSVNGSLSLTPVFINSALSTGLDVNSSVYFLNGTGSFAPPAANTCTGRIYIIVNQTSAVKNFNGSSYINFSGASVTSIPANSGIKIISDGTSWRLIP